MFMKMLSGAMIAGGAAGLLAASLHFALLQDKLLLGEQYESGELSHFAMPAPTQDHGHAIATGAHEVTAHSHDTAEGDAEDGHSHSHASSEEGSDITRNLYTVAFNVLIYVAYAILMTAGFAVATTNGRRIGPSEGVLWGLAGFAAFQMLPALGLPPELPGSSAADISDRQTWWWAAVVASTSGLGLLAYGRSIATAVLGLVLLALPHLIGAPEADGYAGLVPPELSAAFAARVLGVGLIVWTFLGWLAGKLWADEPFK